VIHIMFVICSLLLCLKHEVLKFKPTSASYVIYKVFHLPYLLEQVS
jgi:hypothetical protein